MNVLIIDDEASLLEKLAVVLIKELYTVETAADGRQGLDKIWNDHYDLIILDIMLPYLSGLEIIKVVRAECIETPVLMLTAKGDIEDKIKGLDLGADDYLAKPFSIPELLARVRALIRRGTKASPIIEIGSLSLDTSRRELFKNGLLVPLTAKEFAILEFMMHNKGRAISRFTLAEHVWGDEFDPFSMSNFIDVHMSNLRKKLTSPGEPPLIATVRGYGYRIDPGEK
jgi:DNA-binding response OmpR family regulator